MKRKLIEVSQEFGIVCDNETCDYKVKNESGDINEDFSHYLNQPCPKCGENLLTEEDHLTAVKLVNTINWINKWFSWLTFFIPKHTKVTKTHVKTHKGIHITEIKDNGEQG